MKRVLLVGVFVMFGFCQDALVLELRKEDAARAKELYNRLTQAQKEWDDFVWSVRLKYTSPPPGTDTSEIAGAGRRGGVVLRDWGSGIRFTKDFRYIVPK